jgi:hypothetical protein
VREDVPHASRLVPPGPTVLPWAATAAADALPAGDLVQRVDGDPEELGRLLAALEPLRADHDAVVVTDADAEAVRFLAVLAVLERRAPMPDYDLADPSLKWHAPAGVQAIPNPPEIDAARSGGGA